MLKITPRTECLIERHCSAFLRPHAMPQLESLLQIVHSLCMKMKVWNRRHGFWVLALCWLPAGVLVQAVARFLPQGDGVPIAGTFMWTIVVLLPSLVVLAPCGLPLALGCRKLWRTGRYRAAWWVGVSLGALTVAASVFAGLLGPIAIATLALMVSAPAWVTWWWFTRGE